MIIKGYGGGPVGLETLAAALGEEAVTLWRCLRTIPYVPDFPDATPQMCCQTCLWTPRNTAYIRRGRSHYDVLFTSRRNLKKITAGLNPKKQSMSAVRVSEMSRKCCVLSPNGKKASDPRATSVILSSHSLFLLVNTSGFTANVFLLHTPSASRSIYSSPIYRSIALSRSARPILSLNWSPSTFALTCPPVVCLSSGKTCTMYSWLPFPLRYRSPVRLYITYRIWLCISKWSWK